MTLLERIESPADLRALDRDQLVQLCREIREYTVDAVQKTGGHISSSLGATELTVALHRAFASQQDNLPAQFSFPFFCILVDALVDRRNIDVPTILIFVQ